MVRLISVLCSYACIWEKTFAFSDDLICMVGLGDYLRCCWLMEDYGAISFFVNGLR